MSILWLFIGLVIGAAAAGAYATVVLKSRRTQERVDSEAARAESARLVAAAETRQKELLLEAKDEAIRLRTQAETELTERRAEVARQERRLAQREENLDRKSDAFERRERALSEREAEIDAT